MADEVDKVRQVFRKRSRSMRKVSKPTPGNRVLVLRGATSIRRHADLFRQAALRMGHCSMHGLEHSMEREVRSGKIPVAAVLVGPAADMKQLGAADVEAVMVVYEYCVLGVPTGVLSTQDTSGFRAVLSSGEGRERFVAEASEALLRRRAHLLLVSFEDRGSGGKLMLEELNRAGFGRRTKVKVRSRTAEQSLTLLSTLDGTLATLGKHTRQNLRYYARRLRRDHPCGFVADAGALMTEPELLRMNAESRNPMQPSNFLHACRAVREGEGGYLCGLRTEKGEWLSLIGGWRQESTTVVEWQCNHAGYERYSMTTAMRMFFLEHEISLGMRSLRFFGGTPHSIQHSFEKADLTDVLFSCGRGRAFCTRCCSRWFGKANDYRQRQNFLVQFLSDQGLGWTTVLRAQRKPLWAAVRG